MAKKTEKETKTKNIHEIEISIEGKNWKDAIDKAFAKKKGALVERLSRFVHDFILQDAVFGHFDQVQLAFVLSSPSAEEGVPSAGQVGPQDGAHPDGQGLLSLYASLSFYRYSTCFITGCSVFAVFQSIINFKGAEPAFMDHPYIRLDMLSRILSFVTVLSDQTEAIVVKTDLPFRCNGMGRYGPLLLMGGITIAGTLFHAVMSFCRRIRYHPFAPFVAKGCQLRIL